MLIDWLNSLEETGKLKEGVQLGAISTTLLEYREIYFKFLQYRATGLRKMEAYTLISERHGVSDQTVMTACREMKKSIKKQSPEENR